MRGRGRKRNDAGATAGEVRELQSAARRRSAWYHQYQSYVNAASSRNFSAGLLFLSGSRVSLLKQNYRSRRGTERLP